MTDNLKISPEAIALRDIVQVRNTPAAPRDFSRFPHLAIVDNHLRELDRNLGDNVDGLYDLMEHLRAQKDYQSADRLRTLTGRIARLQRTLRGEEVVVAATDPNAKPIRELARTFK